MFKQLKKAKSAGPITAKRSREIICGACGYTRKESDINPAWQCPACKAAYNKATKKSKAYSPAELQKINSAYLRKKAESIKAEDKKTQIKNGLAGMYAGFLTFTSGLASACSGAAANPLVQITGAVIAIGSLVYLLSRILN